MPVIILIGSAARFADQLASEFKDMYTPIVLKGHFQSIRSSLANQKEDSLYILPDLEKPDRYEIFCLARKNEQQFISITDKSKEGLSNSDKNVLVLEEFNLETVKSALEKSKSSKTLAHKRTKGVSLKEITEVKTKLAIINAEFQKKRPEAIAVLKECEETVIRMYNKGLFKSIEEFDRSYREMIQMKLNIYKAD